MVRKVIEMVYKEVRGLHQAAYVLGVFAFGSQLLALLRDRLLAHQFGAGIEMDLYYAAFRIPDLLYVLFASTLSVYVLIPFVASRIKNNDSTEAQALLSQIFSVFLIVYTGLAVCIFFLIPFLIPFVFPGMSEHSEALVGLIRILLLQPFFLGLSSLFGVVTQLGHRFVLYAISPLIYNVGIILGIVFLYPQWGLSGLVGGVVLGALGHMAIQFPLVRSSALSFGLARNISWGLIAEVLKVSVPRALTLALHQIVLLILVGVASLMTVGSVSVFQFAYNLQSVPLAVIGASYSIAAFPLLADLFAQKRMHEFQLHIVTALRHIIFWSVPIIGLIIVLRAQLVRVVLGSGEFDWGDTRLTAAVLALLVISLVAQAVNLLIVRVFYAGGYTKVPFIITLIGSSLAVFLTFFFHMTYVADSAFNLFLERFMRVTDVPGTEVMMIAVGYSIAITLQMFFLLYFAVRIFSIKLEGMLAHVSRALIASFAGAFVAYATLQFFVEGINRASFLGIFIQGLLAGAAGVAGVIFTYYILKSPELTEVYKAVHSKVFKTEVVVSQEDVL